MTDETRIQALEAVLAFYAAEENWIRRMIVHHDDGQFMVSPIVFDLGAAARLALGHTQETIQ